MNKKLMLLLGTMVMIVAVGVILISVLNSTAIQTTESEDDTIKIVTTFYPVYMIGTNVTDQIEGIEVKSLTDMNTGCLHDYQLTTEDMKSISNADILIINGGGMETFLKDIVENYPELTIIDSSSNITMLENEEDSDKVLNVEHGDEEAGEVEEPEEEEEEHGVSEYNPHIWLNPSLYHKQIENIREGIINYIENDDKINSDDSARLIQSIEQNTKSYLQTIEDFNTLLDEELSDAIANGTGPENTLQAVIFHDSFAYLADRIGIQVAFTVPLDSDSALSAGDIATIIDVVKEKNIKYLFIEQQFSDSIAKQIEAETDAKMYIIDSVVTGDGSKESYLKAMQENLEVLKEALKNE